MEESDEWKSLKLKSFNEGFNGQFGEESVSRSLADLLNLHFGIGGHLGGQDYFAVLFGSVLSDLPKDVFLELRSRRNVFYLFTPNEGSEVKHFFFDEKWDHVIVVNFPYALSEMDDTMAAKGSIVHELAHVHSHSDSPVSSDEREDEADKIAIDWGFGAEIEKMREFEKDILGA